MQRRALRFTRDLPAGHRLGARRRASRRGPCPPDGLPPYRIDEVLGRDARGRRDRRRARPARGSWRERRIVCTIEARMTSSRLPGKVLLPAAGKPLLELMIERLRRARASTRSSSRPPRTRRRDPIVALAERLGVGCFRGSEDDVLARVLGAAQAPRRRPDRRDHRRLPADRPGVVDQVVDASATAASTTARTRSSALPARDGRAGVPDRGAGRGRRAHRRPGRPRARLALHLRAPRALPPAQRHAPTGRSRPTCG